MLGGGAGGCGSGASAEEEDGAEATGVTTGSQESAELRAGSEPGMRLFQPHPSLFPDH